MSKEYLQQLIGEWEGTTKTWFEPEVVADESPWRGLFRPMLEGQVIVHEYEGSMQGKDLSGQATWGFNPMLGRWESAWVDSFHNREIMYSVGTGAEPNVLGQWHVEGGPAWGWRTTMAFRAPDELVITMYIITPDGEESKGVETRYTRRVPTVTPVPAGHNSVSPYLMVKHPSVLIDFLRQAFDAVELGRVSRPEGAIMHAEVKLGDSVVMLAEATGDYPPMPCMVHIYLADVDAAYQRALQAGATSIMAPTDDPNGDRLAGVLGPCGNQWWIATHKKDVAWGDPK